MFHHSVAGQAVSAPHIRPAGEVGGFLRGLITLPGLAVPPQPPRGDGGTVRVLPGYLCSDITTVALRGYLRSRGFRARGWGLGVNKGEFEDFASAVVDLVQRDAAESGRPVRIVGWSWGGVIGREVARRAPDAVSHVVTLASPVVGGPKYTFAAASYRSGGRQLDEIDRMVARRNSRPMPVPVTAFYSKADSMVAWQACLDPNPLSPTRHVEVPGQHCELGFSTPVLRLVARALADGR